MAPSYVNEFIPYFIVLRLIYTILYLFLVPYMFAHFQAVHLHKQGIPSGSSYKLLFKWPFVAVYTRVECEVLPASHSNSS